MYERVNVHHCGYSTVSSGAHGLYLKGSGHALLDSEVWDVFEYLDRNSCVSARHEDVRIQGNRIHGCYAGLGVFDETGEDGVVDVRRNEFWDNSNAVHVDGSDEQTVRVSNNSILGTRKSASGQQISRGIYVSDSPSASHPVPGRRSMSSGAMSIIRRVR